MNENVECSETKMNLRVTLDWRTTLATAVLLPTLLFLGFWQLDRADEKIDLIARMDERRVLPPITPFQAQQLRAEELADRQLAMNATFTDGQYVLLDNRLRSGRFGYEVVAFIQDRGLLVPLNLGWIEGDASRQTLPEVSLPVGTHELTGRLYQP
ncbi:MAG: SURF1 family protein, partial [Halieaceae bacterium]|nr:SURF1 family protein [Halieaceae bacterium]